MAKLKKLKVYNVTKDMRFAEQASDIMERSKRKQEMKLSKEDLDILENPRSIPPAYESSVTSPYDKLR